MTTLAPERVVASCVMQTGEPSMGECLVGKNLQNQKKRAPKSWALMKLFEDPSIFLALGYQRYEIDQSPGFRPASEPTGRVYTEHLLPILDHLVESPADDNGADPVWLYHDELDALSSVENTLFVITRSADLEVSLAPTFDKLLKSLRRGKPLPKLLTDEQLKRVSSIVFDASHFRDLDLDAPQDFYSDLLGIERSIRGGAKPAQDQLRRMKARLRSRGAGASTKIASRYFVLALAAVFEKYNAFGEPAIISARDNEDSDAVGSLERLQNFDSPFFDFLRACKKPMATGQPEPPKPFGGLEVPESSGGLKTPIPFVAPDLDKHEFGSWGREILQKWRSLYAGPRLDEFVNFHPSDFPALIRRISSLK